MNFAPSFRTDVEGPGTANGLTCVSETSGSPSSRSTCSDIGATPKVRGRQARRSFFFYPPLYLETSSRAQHGKFPGGFGAAPRPPGARSAGSKRTRKRKERTRKSLGLSLASLAKKKSVTSEQDAVRRIGGVFMGGRRVYSTCLLVMHRTKITQYNNAPPPRDSSLVATDIPPDRKCRTSPGSARRRRIARVPHVSMR